MKLTTAVTGLLVLAAIVVANLLVNHYGPSVTPYVAFGLIGFDIVGRDRLHLDLQGHARWLAIGVLIALGSGITYLLNQNAGPVALGSVTAFAAAMTVDTVVFQLSSYVTGNAQRRVNVSNVFAAATDTLIFFAIAFGLSIIPFALLFAQFTAKVAGGAIFALFVVGDEVEELYEPDAVLARNP